MQRRCQGLSHIQVIDFIYLPLLLAYRTNSSRVSNRLKSVHPTIPLALWAETQKKTAEVISAFGRFQNWKNID